MDLNNLPSFSKNYSKRNWIVSMNSKDLRNGNAVKSITMDSSIISIGLSPLEDCLKLSIKNTIILSSIYYDNYLVVIHKITLIG
jgi:uncharacterized lipoprotein YajG